ncbi:hypothetical protein GQ53DRAFT_743398 [Thozetella sp. PMI_491]|nr:hypothetical protein GQ53DRAFT_743398 [Thozetella sp. PMI_491]
MADSLRALITPELLHFVLDAHAPFSTTEPLDFGEVGRHFFRSPPDLGPLRDRVWPVLLALSKIGLDEVPNLIEFLPPPSDPDFPPQAMGLQFLIDQGPRAFCQEGIDGRWTNAYFDVINLRYAKALDALPEAEKPQTWARWKELTTLDYWVVIRPWFITPFVHTDTAECQERALELQEETRRVVEEATGTTDPYRAQRSEILSDIYGFPRVVMAGPPLPNATLAEYAYWICMLLDIHKPIVDKFGRYPYRNGFFGREDTPEEVEWLEKTNNFGAPSEEVRKLIKKDIDAGVWTPLGASLDS